MYVRQKKLSFEALMILALQAAFGMLVLWLAARLGLSVPQLTWFVATGAVMLCVVVIGFSWEVSFYDHYARLIRFNPYLETEIRNFNFDRLDNLVYDLFYPPRSKPRREVTNYRQGGWK